MGALRFRKEGLVRGFFILCVFVFLGFVSLR